MSAENKALVQETIEEVFNLKKIRLVNTLYSPWCQGHSPDGSFKNRDACISLLQRYITTFPNFRMSTQQIIHEDDWVALHYMFVGTNTGSLGIFPASGLTLTLPGLVVSRVAKNQITDQYFTWDQSKARHQLQWQTLAA